MRRPKKQSSSASRGSGAPPLWGPGTVRRAGDARTYVHTALLVGAISSHTSSRAHAPVPVEPECDALHRCANTDVEQMLQPGDGSMDPGLPLHAGDAQQLDGLAAIIVAYRSSQCASSGSPQAVPRISAHPT